MVLIKSEKDELDRLGREIEECKMAIRHLDPTAQRAIKAENRVQALTWWNCRLDELVHDRACVLIAAAERIEAET